MKNIFIKDAISNLCPNVSFSIENGEIVTWGSDEIPQPSSSDVLAEATRLQADYDAKQYQRDRQYPSIGEQLDMQYWDAINGTTTWKDAIAQVKADNPKPE